MSIRTSPRRIVSPRLTLSLIACVFAVSLCETRGAQPVMVGIGDSIGEGVQTRDANFLTQPNSYQALIARQIGAPFPLPLINTTPFSSVGEVDFRTRVDPSVVSFNLSVSGAKVGDVLRDRADALSPAQFDSELDLVQFPKLGSQIEIAEALKPKAAIVWIGNNDSLGSVISFDQLDGVSGLTPVDEFEADFYELVERLDAADIYAIYGNMPNVTSIGFLVSRADMIYFTGSDQGLAEGDFTTIIAMLLIRLGLDDATLLEDPDWVLDAAEAVGINERITVFNKIVAEAAASVGAPVVNLNKLLVDSVKNPPVFFGRPIIRRFTGGIFSLDGFHPSNITQAMIANAFIDRTSASLGVPLPRIGDLQMALIALQDPFFDRDGDGRVAGRLGAGLFETVMFLAGFSGDFFDFPAFATRNRGVDVPQTDGSLFRRALLPSKGNGPPTEEDRQRAIEIFKYALGLTD